MAELTNSAAGWLGGWDARPPHGASGLTNLAAGGLRGCGAQAPDGGPFGAAGPT